MQQRSSRRSWLDPGQNKLTALGPWIAVCMLPNGVSMAMLIYCFTQGKPAAKWWFAASLAIGFVTCASTVIQVVRRGGSAPRIIWWVLVIAIAQVICLVMGFTQI